jgi:hypothetical protein
MVCRQSGMRRLQRHQSGVVAVVVGLMMVVLVGVAAFTVDFGRWLIVRNELQNGADASALAGAGYLLNPPVSGKPNWVLATAQAQQAVALNRSERMALQSADVTPGYWDFLARTFDTDTGKAPTANDLPAVRVAIVRTAGQNSGPVLMTLGRIMGIQSIDAQATATAVVSVPNSAGSGQLAPIAITKCMLDPSKGYLDPDGRPVPDASGHPKVFVVASGAANVNHCNGCGCGQWTTFGSADNSAATMKSLIENGNGVAVEVGGNTYIQPGLKSAGYGEVETYLKKKYIVVPVVGNGDLRVGPDNEDAKLLERKGFAAVTGYACLRVLAGIQGGPSGKVCNEYPAGTPIPDGGGQTGENKCVIAQFAAQPCPVGEANGTTGTFSGVYVPPRLVQ